MSADSHNKLQQGFVLVLLVVVGLGFLGMIRQFLIALVLAAIFAGLLYPFFCRVRALLGERSMAASLATLVICSLVAGLPLVLFVGVVASEAIQVTERVRPMVQGALASDVPLAERVPEWVPFAEYVDPYRETILRKAAQAASAAGKLLVSNLSNATRGTLGFLLGLFVMLYAMFYFFIRGPDMLGALQSLLPLSAEDRKLVVDRGLTVTQASLKGILVIGAIQGVLVGLAFWAAGITGPAFWGTIVFLLSAIPGLGAPLIWLPAAIYLIATGSVGWGIALIAWGAIVVGLVDNLLRPMIVGQGAKLPDVVVLVSILGGIATFGAPGILLGPVIAAILDTLLEIYRRIFADNLPT